MYFFKEKVDIYYYEVAKIQIVKYDNNGNMVITRRMK